MFMALSIDTRIDWSQMEGRIVPKLVKIFKAHFQKDTYHNALDASHDSKRLMTLSMHVKSSGVYPTIEYSRAKAERAKRERKKKKMDEEETVILVCYGYIVKEEFGYINKR
ncbi:hypothetical protein LXL04_015287 [Taraxacum kok-saghyz]